jgi:hypothetical protein
VGVIVPDKWKAPSAAAASSAARPAAASSSSSAAAAAAPPGSAPGTAKALGLNKNSLIGHRKAQMASMLSQGTNGDESGRRCSGSLEDAHPFASFLISQASASCVTPPYIAKHITVKRAATRRAYAQCVARRSEEGPVESAEVQ